MVSSEAQRLAISDERAVGKIVLQTDSSPCKLYVGEKKSDGSISWKLIGYVSENPSNQDSGLAILDGGTASSVYVSGANIDGGSA